jgi:signal transduction histidine kinase
MTNPTLNESSGLDLERLNQQLIERYTEIARLAGGLAHEIKNPLSTIRLNMDLLAEEFANPESPKERRALAKIRVVQRECQRLQELLDSFLDFAKVRRYHFQPSDLNHVLRQLLDLYKAKLQQAGIEVIDYLASDLPLVLLDREAFESALSNLIINAEQAMPNGGQLVVRTYRTPDGVALELIDTGCGMDEHTLEHIFEAFFSTKKGGSGLGLPTAKRIIEGHGGTIEVRSQLGTGTQFTIRIPAPRCIPAEPPQERLELPAEKGGN